MNASFARIREDGCVFGEVEQIFQFDWVRPGGDDGINLLDDPWRGHMVGVMWLVGMMFHGRIFDAI